MISKEYARHLGYPIRDRHGTITGYRLPRGGASIEALLDRPPFGPALAGRRATAGGRGHRRAHRADTTAERAELVMRAFELRVLHGWTIRAIAPEVGRSPSIVGRWLRAIPACGGHALDPLLRSIDALTAQVGRHDQAAERDGERAP